MGNSVKKYHRAGKALAKSVLTVSLSLQEGIINEDKAKSTLKDDARMVLRKHGRQYVLDAGTALVYKLDRQKFINMDTKKGKMRVKLFYEPLVQFIESLR